MLSSIVIVAVRNPRVANHNRQEAYWLFQAAVTVIWWAQRFEKVRVAHPAVLAACGVIGMLASARR